MTFQAQIAKITGTFLGANEDTHGILTAQLTVDLGGSQTRSVGGYSLGSKDTAFGMQFVAALMRAAGAQSWESMVGRTVFVLTDEHDRVVGIENLPTEPGERFVFDELVVQYPQKDLP